YFWYCVKIRLITYLLMIANNVINGVKSFNFITGLVFIKITMVMDANVLLAPLLLFFVVLQNASFHME
ncbi:MAG TPA: hypothetical protein PLS49_09930, partial [Candidatus Woesebacteria bacterium]|nr:hypothetical protein [Candidatus Woesebacteria bacterium]